VRLNVLHGTFASLELAPTCKHEPDDCGSFVKRLAPRAATPGWCRWRPCGFRRLALFCKETEKRENCERARSGDVPPSRQPDPRIGAAIGTERKYMFQQTSDLRRKRRWAHSSSDFRPCPERGGVAVVVTDVGMGCDGTLQPQRRLRPQPPPTSLRISRRTTAPINAFRMRATIPTPR